MSAFDENPFGSPSEDNPFSDPAIQQVTKQTSSVQKGLEDYNPFAADQPPQKPNPVRGASNPPDYNASQTQPAIMQPSQEVEPPSYAKHPSTAELQKRQEELDRKAAELQRREDELRSASYNARRNNWPPLPENCCGLEPCFYQDINVEIRVDFQQVVRHLYYLWLFHTLLLIANVLGALVLLLAFGEFTTFGLSILFTLLFTPFSFLCWYRPGYKAFRDDSSFSFMVFFFVFFFQFVITVIQSIGIGGMGVCGLITTIQCFSKGGVAGILSGILTLIITIGFCAAAFMDLLLLTKIHRIYRSSGASMAKAQAEFTSEFFGNEHVREAASSAANAAFQAQFQQARTPPSRY